MTLNCKPGDLARVISTPATRQANVADKIIKVTELAPGSPFPAWFYEGPMFFCTCGCGQHLEAFGDVLLRPLRGQEGDDETLAWAGKPATHDAPVAA